MPTDTFDRARAWCANDPDPETAAELAALIEAGDEAELAERMAGPLAFGTAGLRGRIGAGESRMNRAVVRRTTDGLARWLLAHVEDAASRGVVVGYDARRMSREFAEDTVGVLAAHGIASWVFPALGPTPLCAFAVLDREAGAGVMVTASHNPANDNGYKVYAADGGQIVPPIDREIAAEIAAAPAARAVVCLSEADARAAGLWRDLEADVTHRWYARIGPWSFDDRGRDLRIVYTPLHGTGDVHAHAILALFGFDDVTSVPAQAAPDGTFPTAPFPNPEEPGVLDLAVALAGELGAPLVLANDPDSDRLAAAIATRAGGYRTLSGNEVGVLLGEWLLRHGTGDDRLFVNSIVSSPQLGGIVRAHGARFAEVLTGFKWIAHEARRLAPARFVFGYEEALGYAVGPAVRDKDGIGALAVFAELVAVARAEGRSVEDELDRIAATYGLWVSAQHNVTSPGTAGAAAIAAMMAELRANPPAEIGGVAVRAVRDVERGIVRDESGERPLDLPRSNVLVFDLDGDARVIVRPSGTEPKIKFYLDLREDVGEGGLDAARVRANARLEGLRAWARAR